jgi:hypothetical protein
MRIRCTSRPQTWRPCGWTPWRFDLAFARIEASAIVRAAGREHPSIMVELGPRKPAWFGFYPRPFDAEPIAVQPDRSGEREVAFVAMIAVASVAGGFLVNRVRQVLEQRAVGIDAIALALMRRDRRAPQEAIWRRAARRRVGAPRAEAAVSPVTTSLRVAVKPGSAILDETVKRERICLHRAGKPGRPRRADHSGCLLAAP